MTPRRGCLLQAVVDRESRQQGQDPRRFGRPIGASRGAGPPKSPFQSPDGPPGRSPGPPWHLSWTSKVRQPRAKGFRRQPEGGAPLHFVFIMGTKLGGQTVN